MLIALLAALGVDLGVLVAGAVVLISRKRWVRRQPGAYRGLIRVVDGTIDGVGPKWRRGYGRWVRDVLVWTKAPFLFGNKLLPTDDLDGPRPARPDEVKRLGQRPVVVRVQASGAMAEIAVRDEDSELLLGPYAHPLNVPATTG